MHFPLITDGVCHREISPRATLSRDDSGEVLNRDDGWEMLSRDDWRVFVMSTAVETSRSSDATYPSPARMAGIDATYPWLD